MTQMKTLILFALVVLVAGISADTAVKTDRHAAVVSLTSAPVCGDRTRSGGEECDDGNLVDGDGCNGLCKREPGFTCPTSSIYCECDNDASCGHNAVCQLRDNQRQCLCKQGWFGPRCQTQCAGECTAAGGTCSASSLNPGFCNCPANRFPSATPGAALCSKTCDPQSCHSDITNAAVGGTCDVVTGDCICKPGYKGARCDQAIDENIAPRTCSVCRLFSASTPGWGVYTFASLEDAQESSRCSSRATIILLCPPAVSMPNPGCAPTMSIGGTNVRIIASPTANVGKPLIAEAQVTISGTNVSVEGITFIPPRTGLSANASVLSVDATSSFTVRGMPKDSPILPTPPYNSTVASTEVCTGFTRQELDSFFDIFADIHAHGPASPHIETAKSHVVMGKLQLPGITTDTVRCIVLFFYGRGLAPTFLVPKSSGARAFTTSVHSPFTMEDTILIGGTNATESFMDVDLNTGGFLTFRNNVVLYGSPTALRVRAVRGMDVADNVFVATGAIVDHAVMLGAVEDSNATFALTGNAVSTSGGLVRDNASAFVLMHSFGAYKLMISANSAPAGAFHHGIVLHHADSKIVGAYCPDGAVHPSKADERCVAKANPSLHGVVTDVTRFALAAPNDGDFCKDGCDAAPPGEEPVDWKTIAIITMAVAGAVLLAFVLLVVYWCALKKATSSDTTSTTNGDYVGIATKGSMVEEGVSSNGGKIGLY